MSNPDHYDIISIGSGEAGRCLCWGLSSVGKKTAVIEDKWICGSCPNIACLPSKNFIFSAESAHLAKKYAATGLLDTQGGNVGVNMKFVQERKRDMVKGLEDMHLDIFKNTGTELVLGRGKLVGEKTVEVVSNDSGRRVLTADNIVICTGSRAYIPDIAGLIDAKPLTHVELLDLDELPKHLIILGGGYISVEFSQAFRRFGAEVSVIEHNPAILKHEDQDVATALVDTLKSEGVKFHTATIITNVGGTSGDSITLTGHTSQEHTPFAITGTHLLVASGRVPNTQDCGLQESGVELTATNHVKVNEFLQTNKPGVFAVGDCAGSPHFTHMGYDDYRIVRDFLTAQHMGNLPTRSSKGRQTPYTLFTSPELAHVGLSEDAAQKQGIPYRLVKLPMSASLRTRAMDETEGFAKALISVDGDEILGFTALGARAGELLPVVQLAMSAKLPYMGIRDLIVTHPTLNEGLVALFEGVPERE